MELTTRLAARLTHRPRVLRGTQESFTLSFGDVFVQAAPTRATPSWSRSVTSSCPPTGNRLPPNTMRAHDAPHAAGPHRTSPERRGISTGPRAHVRRLTLKSNASTRNEPSHGIAGAAGGKVLSWLVVDISSWCRRI